DEQLLRKATCRIGVAPVVLQDHLDLLAGDRRSVLLHPQLDSAVDLAPRRRERAGHGQDEPDLHGVLGERAAARQADGEERRRGALTQHGCSCWWSRRAIAMRRRQVYTAVPRRRSERIVTVAGHSSPRLAAGSA